MTLYTERGVEHRSYIVSGTLKGETFAADLIAISAATPERACARARQIMSAEFKERLVVGSLKAREAHSQ
jgi:hypothetical protein